MNTGVGVVLGSVLHFKDQQNISTLFVTLTGILLFTFNETVHCSCGIKYCFTYKEDVIGLNRLHKINGLNLSCVRQKAERQFITVCNKCTNNPTVTQEITTIMEKDYFLICSPTNCFKVYEFNVSTNRNIAKFFSEITCLKLNVVKTSKFSFLIC